MPENKLKVKSQKSKTEETKNMEKSGAQQIMRGRVVSAKMPKTVTVLVNSTKRHPLYGKSFIRGKKYLALSEDKISEGDLVEIMKIRPISKSKHFKVMRVIGKDIEAIVTEQLKEEAKEAIEEVMPEEREEELSAISSQPSDQKTDNKQKKSRSRKEEKSES